MKHSSIGYAAFSKILSAQNAKPHWRAANPIGYEAFIGTDEVTLHCQIRQAADITDFETNYKDAAKTLADSPESLASSDASALSMFTGERRRPLFTPRTSDGRPVLLQNLFPENVHLYITGAGDDPGNATDKGGGPLLNLSSDAIEDVDLEWGFNDWVYFAGGSIFFSGGELGDWISLKLYVPASTVTVNGTTTGNCNLVAIPGTGGTMNMIVPAAGNGTHDLTTANPVTAMDLSTGNPNGYWSWDEPDEGRGTVTAGTPGMSKFNLYDFPTDLARYVNRFPLIGSDVANVTVESIQPGKALPHWKFKATLHNSTMKSLQVAFYLLGARKKTI